MQARVLDSAAFPPTFWDAADTLDALIARDIGELFRLVRKMTGASQTQIGIATGLSQAQVSEIMSGTRRVTSIDVIARIVDGFRMPHQAWSLLLLGDRRQPGTTATAPVARVVPRPVQPRAPDPRPQVPEPYADVLAVYCTRAEFMSRMPPHPLLAGARQIRAAGLSLNLLCQQYADDDLLHLVERGTRLRCLFLDPDGEATRAREREEGYAEGHLAALTRLNIQSLTRRVRDRLPPECRDNLALATYDETLRFNLLLVDDDLCVAQPYLPHARGVESPTLVLDRKLAQIGLHRTFEQIFESLWERSSEL